MIQAPTLSESLDQNVKGKVLVFSFARLALFGLILFSTIFLRQEVLGPATITRIYAALGISFLFSLVNVAFLDHTLRVRHFIRSQLVYDLLLTSYLVYLTGVSDSIFLFLYLLNIAFASVLFQLPGAIFVATLSGGTFAFLYCAGADLDAPNAVYNLFWIEILFLLTALLCGALMDELKRQRFLVEAQRRSIANLELLNDQLLNSIPVGILVVDAEGFVQKINRTALNLVKMERLPSLRVKYFELFPELRDVVKAWDQLTETQRLRFLFSHEDTTPPHLSLRIVKGLTEDQGELDVLVFQDMAKMIELERRVEFESRLAAAGELAAGIAHEIRNPLASISGCIEMLGQTLKPSEAAAGKLLDISLRETRRLNTLITDFLEFAKPKDDSREDFALSNLVQEVADTLSTGRSENALNVRVEIDSSLQIHANRERMKQVFLNLFLNSLEAAAPKDVKITVRATTPHPTLCQIEVNDDGPGISSSAAEKIFDPFFTTKAYGTGLGLPTVAQIIKAAQGSLTQIPCSTGAHFRIEIPCAKDPVSLPAPRTGT